MGCKFALKENGQVRCQFSDKHYPDTDAVPFCKEFDMQAFCAEVKSRDVQVKYGLGLESERLTPVNPSKPVDGVIFAASPRQKK